MRRFSLAVMPLLLIEAPAPAQQEDEPYRVVGSAPAWTVMIGRNTLSYVGDDGNVTISVPTPRPRNLANGYRYETPRLTVDVVRAPCEDRVGGQRYKDSVTVRLDGRTLQGCGGYAIAGPTVSDLLPEGEYRVTDIGGLRVVAGTRPPRISFLNGRLSADVGCNRISVRYRIERDQLIPGPVISTRMACPGVIARQEQRLTEILTLPVRIEQRMPGEIALRSERQLGDVILQRR